jgi:hypothetical protein
MNRNSWRGALTRLGVAAAVLIGAAQAFAAAVTVDITSAGGGYGYTNTQDSNPDGTFSMSGVAGGAAVGAAFECDWSITGNEDPQITSTFTLTNISAVTQTFTMNITLPIAALGPTTVQGGYYGDAVNGTVYSDANNSGSVTLATVAGTPFYQALVNGILSQGLGTFTLTADCGPGCIGDTSQETWGTPIPSAPFGPASGNIRIRWNFSLTSGDSVSTKGFFQVEKTPAPEPTTAVLLGLGLATLAGLRRRA